MRAKIRSRERSLPASDNDFRDWLAIAAIVLACSLLFWLPVLAAGPA